MQGETTRATIPAFKVAFLAGLLTTAAAIVPANASAVSDNPSTLVMQNDLAARETVITTAASRALWHIARARGYLQKANPRAADHELDKATSLFDLIETSLPTTVAKDLIKTAIAHLGYENAPEVQPDLTAIDRALDDLAGYMPVDSAKKDLGSAEARLRAQDKAGAVAELDKALASLAYTEVDLPLRMTRQRVAAARAALKQGDLWQAGQTLRAAEDNVVFLSVIIHDPVMEAHRSLWQAVRDYGAGAFEAAKLEIVRAIQHLDYVANGSDPKTDAAAKAIAQQARVVTNEIGTKSETAAAQLMALWKRTKALSDRSVAYFATGWQRVKHRSAYKADLIEAKFHLTNAEIDHRVTADVVQVKKELGQVERYLAEAERGAQQKYAKQIAALNTRVKKLAADERPDKASAQYAALKTQMDKLIESL